MTDLQWLARQECEKGDECAKMPTLNGEQCFPCVAVIHMNDYEPHWCGGRPINEIARLRRANQKFRYALDSIAYDRIKSDCSQVSFRELEGRAERALEESE